LEADGKTLNEVISKTYLDLPEKLAGLGELAFNLWWSWHPEARMLFKPHNGMDYANKILKVEQFVYLYTASQ